MLKHLWNTGSAPLTATAVLMLGALAIAATGLVVDDRLITGMPAWVKPAKFAASVAIYTATLAWIFTLLPEWPRTRRLVGWTTAVTLVLEIVLIYMQAFRGTSSHFNASTLFDGIVVGVMGAAILIQTIASVWVAVALWRQRFQDAALGWALRLGVTFTIVGAMTGGLMTRPTADQLEAARAGQPMTVMGAHTVGGPDGGAGIPGIGWSAEHGDLRIAHFVGLHAMQVLPIVAVVLARRRRIAEIVRTRLVVTAAASYAGLFGILLTQALRGQSVMAPDALTVTTLTVWALATVAAAMAAFAGDSHVRRTVVLN
jgi:hypothetical protein